MIIPNSYVLYINIFIGLLYAVMIFNGFRRGLLFELISVLYNILSLVIAWILCPVLASEFPIVSMQNLSEELLIMSHFVDLGPLINSLLYFVIIFLLLRVVYMLIGLLAKSVNGLPVIGLMNKISGAVMGVVNATIIVTVMSLLLVLPIFSNGKEIRNKTVFAYIEKYSDMAIDFVTENMDLEDYKQKYEDFDVDEFRNNIKDWIKDRRNEQ